MSSAPEPVPMHEPEIAIAGRVVRVALLVLRGVCVVVGLLAVAGAIWTMAEPTVVYANPEDVPPLPSLIAHQLVFVCFGLPLILPTPLLFGRWRGMLAAGALLWFAPVPWDGDMWYACVLRLFASLVAVSILGVWRTVFGLTKPLG